MITEFLKFKVKLKSFLIKTLSFKFNISTIIERINFYKLVNLLMSFMYIVIKIYQIKLNNFLYLLNLKT